MSAPKYQYRAFVAFAVLTAGVARADFGGVLSSVSSVQCDPGKPIQADPSRKFGRCTEWGEAKKVLMARVKPQDLTLALGDTSAALYEDQFNIEEAGREQDVFRRKLEEEGAKVYDLREAILEGVVDNKGNPIPGPKHNEFVEFARKMIRRDLRLLPPAKKKLQLKRIEKDLRTGKPAQVLDLIFQNPTYVYRPESNNTGVSAQKQVNPVDNIQFQRDPMITTRAGIVLGNLNSPQRAHEVKIVEFALHKMGIKPVIKIKEPGKLEGGDFIPVGDTVFIGRGMRTNQAAIDQLLKAKAFGPGVKKVVVVDDRRNDQSQMHLDTRFNVLGPNGKGGFDAVLLDTRYPHRDSKGVLVDPPVKDRMYVNVYELDPSTEQYKQTKLNGAFHEYLEKELKANIVPASQKVQDQYGINFLSVGTKTPDGRRKIFYVEGVTDQDYLNRIRALGYELVPIPYENMKMGFGALHCTSQVISSTCPPEIELTMVLGETPRSSCSSSKVSEGVKPSQAPTGHHTAEERPSVNATGVR